MNYATPNQGLAAFFATQGQQVAKVTKKPSKFGESYFFEFDVPVEKGREIAADFYDKKTQVAPRDLFEEVKKLRELVRDARTNEN